MLNWENTYTRLHSASRVKAGQQAMGPFAPLPHHGKILKKCTEIIASLNRDLDSEGLREIHMLSKTDSM